MGFRQKTHDGLGHYGFPGSGFSHDAKNFIPPQTEAEIYNRMRPIGALRQIDPEILNFEDEIVHGL
jgi:hypothetical protein